MNFKNYIVFAFVGSMNYKLYTMAYQTFIVCHGGAGPINSEVVIVEPLPWFGSNIKLSSNTHFITKFSWAVIISIIMPF